MLIISSIHLIHLFGLHMYNSFLLNLLPIDPNLILHTFILWHNKNNVFLSSLSSMWLYSLMALYMKQILFSIFFKRTLVSVSFIYKLLQYF